MFRAACLKERTRKYLSARGRPTIAPSIINLSCMYKAEAFTYSSEDLPILIIQKKKQENKRLAFVSIKVSLVFSFCVSIAIFSSFCTMQVFY